MALILPDVYEALFQPVFEALPFDDAMEALVIKEQPSDADAAAAVQRAVRDEALSDRPDLVAGLWLYVDELDKAHAACQDLDTPTGSFWHLIVHRREGDFSNARYWVRKTGKHPAMDHIDLTGGGAGTGTTVAAYDPEELVDRVERATKRGDRESPALESAQRKEWQALFGWCVEH